MHVITMTTSFSKLFLNWNQRRRGGDGWRDGGRGDEKTNHSSKEINELTIVDKIRRSVVVIIGGLGWSGESLQNYPRRVIKISLNK